MKSFIYIMGVALLLVFCSCEKQGEQEQGTQRTEQGQGEKPEPESPEEPPLVENWDLIEITRAEVGNSNYEELLYLASLAGLVNRSLRLYLYEEKPVGDNFFVPEQSERVCIGG